MRRTLSATANARTQRGTAVARTDARERTAEARSCARGTSSAPGGDGREARRVTPHVRACGRERCVPRILVHLERKIEEPHANLPGVHEAGAYVGKVLRVLVDQTFQRVGGAKKVKVDVRVVSSTSRNLPSLIAVGRFREDLFHRLGVVPVQVPGLADRREDIPELISYFSRNYSTTSGQPMIGGMPWNRPLS